MRLSPREIDPSLRDASAWPAVEPSMVPTARARAALERRVASVKAWLDGTRALSEIEREFRVRRCELYRWIQRCLQAHDDGRIWGFRALIPHQRRAPNQPKPHVDPASAPGGKSGQAGQLRRLFTRFPELEELVDATLFQKTSPNRVPLRLPLRDVHGLWVQRCRDLGVSDDEWPLNTAYFGKVSLYKHMRRRLREEPARAVFLREGEDPAKKLRRGTVQGPFDPSVRRPFKRVIFDGHRIDAVFVLQLDDGSFVELQRAWLLVVQDVGSGAILAYSLCFRAEFSADDVLLCLKRAVMPWRRTEVSVTGLTYPERGGLPNEVLPQLCWVCWDEVWFDRALANLATAVRSELLECMGASVNFGPPATPTYRGLIEKCFHLLEEAGFAKLPNTTGRHPGDPRRPRDPAAQARRYGLTERELVAITEVVVADYNSRGHRGQAGISPLECLRQYANAEGGLLRRIEPTRRHRLSMFVRRFECTVRGNLRKGTQPHVNFKSARYSSAALRTMPGLVGGKVVIHVDPADLRTVKAFLPGGAELGLLEVQRPWRGLTHSLRDRVDACSRIQIRMARDAARPHALHGLRPGPVSKAEAARIAEGRVRPRADDDDGSPDGVRPFHVALSTPDREEALPPLRRGLVDRMGPKAMDL
jgi:putative transposase